MFEAILKITALMQEDEQGQGIFKIFADQPTGSDLDFLVSTVYYQDMYHILQAGDILTTTFQNPKTVRQVVANFLHHEQWSYAFSIVTIIYCSQRRVLVMRFPHQKAEKNDLSSAKSMVLY